MKGGEHIGIHSNIRFATWLENAEAALTQIEEDVRIARALVRTAHDDVRAKRPIREQTYDELHAA